MATKFGVTPPDLNACKTYEAFKREITAWASVTDLAKSKQGNYVALSLPNKSQFGNDLRERVFENLSPGILSADDGLQKVIDFLDKELGKDAIDDVIEKWDEFDSCRKESEQSLEDFIAEYEMKSNRVKATGTSLSGEILAYMLMKRAGLSNLERMLVLSRVDMTDKNNLYKNVKLNMSNILGKCMKTKQESVPAIKLEPALLAQHEDVLAAAGYYRGRANTVPNSYQKGNKSRFQKSGFSKKPYEQKLDKGGRPINAKGPDGKMMTCRACGSFRHLIKQCPDSYEKKKFGTYHVEDDEDSSCNLTESLSEEEDFEIERFVLFTSDREELSRFTSESINCAALDTCCTSTVAGEKWLNIYLKSLSSKMKKNVVGPVEGKKCFQFGNQGVLKSKGRYKIPAIIAGTEQSIEVDIISSDIPMLLSKADMKRLGVTLFMLEDKVEILGKTLDLNTTSAGNYLLPLDEAIKQVDESFKVEDAFAIDLKSANCTVKTTALRKIHKQFGHRPKKSFTNLLKSADSYTEDMSKILDDIIENCEGCIKRKRNPDRPAVAMPMANEFNEKIAIDLKIWKGQYILYMIDMWSRLTKAKVISRKKPSMVIDAIMQEWVANFGVMSAILNDNGGEFTGEEIREVKSVLNVVDLTTAAESPWQNGLCEKNHALADNILERMDDDYPTMSLQTKVSWACMAKNSLQMVYGYSPNQFVFGKNPKLPNILVDGPPAWEETTMSESLATHLNALHSARKAFIQSESCARLKTALKAKIRCKEVNFNNGDVVYYKRDRDERWMGPAKVVFQDGKLIFIRHGSFFVRVSPNRIQLAGEELAKQYEGDLSKDFLVERNEDSSKDLNDDLQENQSKDFPNQRMKSMVAEFVCEDSSKNPDNSPECEPIVSQNSMLDSSKDPVSSQNFSKDPDPSKDLKISEKLLLKRNDQIRFREGEDWVEATIVGRGKTTGKYKNWFNVQRSDGKENHSVNLESVEFEMLNNPDAEYAMMITIPKEEQNSPECLEAKIKELAKLESFETYSTVPDEGQERISTTWVMTNKGSEVRARLTARGYEETSDIQKDSPTLCKSTLRIILCIAATKRWKVETTDIKSAFLQGSQLERDVFIKPPKEANVDKGFLWKLNKCLYGLKDASRQWYFKVRGKLIDANFSQSEQDPGLFVMHDNVGKTVGIVGLHVDDFIHAGSDSFNDSILYPILKSFQVGKNEKENFMYTGFYIKQSGDSIVLDQSKYTKSTVEIIEMDPKRMKEKTSDLTESERTDLRKMAGALNWIVRATRPDLAFEMIELSTKFKGGIVDDLIRVRKALLNTKMNKAEILIPAIENPNNWQILCFTDAALGNLNDGVDSTGGHIVFLTDSEQKKCAVLDWHANKIKRVVRSTLAAEALSLCDGLETVLHIRRVLEDTLNLPSKTIKIHGIVDNRSTVDAVKSTTVVDDKRLRREIGAIKKLLERGDINSITWVPGSEQLADVLTKRGVNSCKLLNVIQTGKLM